MICIYEYIHIIHTASDASVALDRLVELVTCRKLVDELPETSASDTDCMPVCYTSSLDYVRPQILATCLYSQGKFR